MDAVHWHLLLNHFPIVATLIGSILLIAGLYMKNKGVIHSSLIIMVASTLIAIPVFFTGEGAEEVAEHLEAATIDNISHDIIHEHEEMGETAMLVMYALGAFALLSLVLSLRRHALTKLITIITLLLSLTAFVLMVRTGQSGGKIRHSEIRE